MIPKNLNLEEIEYLIRLHRLEDITKKQNKSALEINDPDVRSPSPEPVYDPSGRRINTIENRAKNSVLMEKNYLIEESQKMNVGFMTPFDWKSMKKTTKIFFPEIDVPELNFVSMVLGPKGRTQKLLEELSNCRISVKGRLASKNKRSTPQDDEKTHILVQAENDQDLKKGVELVQKVLRGDSLQSIAGDEKKYIKTGYEMIAVDTILRDFCENCHEEGHKLWNCPYTFNENLKNRQAYFKSTNNTGLNAMKMVYCEICGSKTHLKRDCFHKNITANEQALAMNAEYYKFISELNDQELEVEDLKPSTGNQLTNFITNYTDTRGTNKMIKEK